MDKEELLEKITILENELSNIFDDPEKTLKAIALRRLKIKLEGLSLRSIVQIMNNISLPEISEMESNLKASLDATKSNKVRVDTFNNVYMFIKNIIDTII